MLLILNCYLGTSKNPFIFHHIILSLFYRKGTAVLPQLLVRLSSPSVENSLQLIFFEYSSGTPQPAVENCLQWIAREDETLMHFSNNLSCLLPPNVKFLIIVRNFRINTLTDIQTIYSDLYLYLITILISHIIG